ncbi:MAG: type II secretion system F family protein [Syntrophobacterales bacterium]|nr:type II secretion system F family protein [Syntrophobacterales bacterium]
MAFYRYKVFDPITGKITIEQDEFQDPQELITTIRVDRKILLSYTQVKPIFLLRRRKKVTRLEMAEFCRNFSFLLSAGVPIIQSLEDLSTMSEHKELAGAIKKVIKNVRRGLSLSESFELSKEIFPPIVRSLVNIGETTGQLDKTMEKASTHLTRVNDIITQTNKAMVYPAFVISSIGIALVVWFFYVLPKVFAVFKQMNVRLPLPTIILMKFVDILKDFWIVIPAFGILITFFLFLAKKYEPIGYRAEKLILRLPILGILKRLSIMAFFFEYLSLILGAGIDILGGLNIMKESTESRTMKRLIPSISANIQSGRMFSESCHMTGFFRPLEIRIISIGEESGKLVEQMKILGDFYYKRLMEFVESLPKIIEPLLIIVVGGIFIVVVIALMGPIYELVSIIGKTR